MSEGSYYLGLWNEAKKGCFKILAAVGLLWGFKFSIEVTRFNASCGTEELNHYCRGLCLMFTSLIIVIAVSEFRASMSYCLGFPVNERILSSWLRVEFPGKMGFPSRISAKIQPTLQMSALLS